MTFYDIVMLVVFIGAVIHGYCKGLAWQVASVAAIVVGYIVSINFRSQLAPVIQVEEPWDRIAAMLILFLGTSLAIWIAYAYVTKSMEKLELKGFDQQAGALVGGITGALLCMVITMFSVSFIGDQANRSISESRLGPYIVTGIDQVSGVLPPEITPYVHRYVVEWNQNKPQFENPLGSQAGPTGLNGTPVYPESPFTPANSGQGNWGVNRQAGFVTGSEGTTNTGTGSFGGALGGNSSGQMPAGGSTWAPPKIEIKVDSEDILKRIEQLLNKSGQGNQ